MVLLLSFYIHICYVNVCVVLDYNIACKVGGGGDDAFGSLGIRNFFFRFEKDRVCLFFFYFFSTLFCYIKVHKRIYIFFMFMSMYFYVFLVYVSEPTWIEWIIKKCWGGKGECREKRMMIFFCTAVVGVVVIVVFVGAVLVRLMKSFLFIFDISTAPPSHTEYYYIFIRGEHIQPSKDET